MDVVFAGQTSHDFVENISPHPLDTFHASSSCSRPSPSPEYCDILLIDSHAILEGNEVDCSETLDTFRGYNPSLDPYNLYLEHSPRKIVLILAFDYCTDFSNALDKFRGALIIMRAFIFTCSYLHSSELHA